MARKVIGPTGSRRRRWLFLCTTIAAFAAAGFYISGAFATITGPPASPSSFEAGDGNMLNDVNGNADWNCFANGNSTGFAATGVNIDHACSTKLDYGAAVQVSADNVTTPTCTTAPCEISWVNGQKFDTACPALAVNNNPPKDEFTHVASYNETDPTTKDLFFYGATIRPNTNGNSTGNVELDQRAGNGTTTAGCRTAGDRLIAYDFLNGGTALNFHVLTWITDQIPGVTDKLGGNSGSGACFVKTDTDAFNTTTGSGGCWGANVITETNNDLSTFEGGVNTGANGHPGQIAAADNGISGGTGGETVPQLAFAEFGINASKAFGTEGQCTSFAQVQWESRSSGSSFTSNPQDIETESKTVSNCAEVIMRKVTSPANKDQAFSFTSNLPTTSDSPVTSSSSPYCEGTNNPTSFSLNDKSYTITSVTAATHAVVTTSTANNFVVGQRVTISSSNSTPSLNGDQIVTAVSADHKSFTVAGTTTIAGTAGSVIGNAEDCNNVLAGNYTVTESAQAGYKLTGINCNNSSTGHGSTATGDTSTRVTTINLKPSDVIDCTYTNTLNTATLATQVSSSAVFPATSVHDTATVTGTAGSGDPFGNVTFFLCSPATVTSNGGNCSSGGTNIGTGALSGTAGSGISSANSPNVNCASDGSGCFAGDNPLGAGTYCFRAEWPGDTNYPGALSEYGGSSGTNECFTVSTLTTTTVTTPSPGKNGSTTFGNATVTDTAVVEATADGGGIPTGSVEFDLCSPSQMAALSESTCASGGTLVDASVTLGSVDGGLAHPSASATSSAFTHTVNNVALGVNETGTWCWRAVYTPSGSNGNNYTTSSDHSSTECFTVTDTTTSSSAQTWYPNDSASVSADHGALIYGTLTIQLYSNGDCGVGESGAGAVSGQSYHTTVTKANATGTISVDSKTAGVPQTSYGVVGPSSSVSWKVTFASGDPNVSNPAARCESSSLTVTN